MATHRIALVTGGMGGLGEAICMKMAALGYTVVTTHSPGNTKASEWLQSMKGQGYTFRAYPCDVASFDSAVACVKHVSTDLGPIDVLVNNAGITRDDLAPSLDDDQWSAVIETDLTAAFRLTRRALKSMMRARSGRIVNISSVVALRANPGQSNYAAAKAGLIAFTKTAAVEVARRSVTINAVAPGWIETEMTADVSDDLLKAVPARRAGKPEEVAACVRFLVSEEAAYVTGAVLSVDGGLAA
jgi:acetoacetyl-CoA reductase